MKLLFTNNRMAATLWALSLACAVVLAAKPTAAEVTSPLTLEGLLKLDQAALDTIYREGEAGELPRGVVRGKAVVVPGMIVPAQMFFFSFWQGKEFSDDGKTLYNRVFGVNRFQGETYLGTSWLDSKPSWYIDYRNTAPAIYQIHDEYRQVAPGLWLGRTYLRGENPPLVLNFVIESTPQTPAPTDTDSEKSSKEREEKLQETLRGMYNDIQAP